MLGVAGGLGRALAIDPLLIRIAFVVLALFSGVGIVLYIAALLLLADSPTSPPPSTIRRIAGSVVDLARRRGGCSVATHDFPPPVGSWPSASSAARLRCGAAGHRPDVASAPPTSRRWQPQKADRPPIAGKRGRHVDETDRAPAIGARTVDDRCRDGGRRVGVARREATTVAVRRRSGGRRWCWALVCWSATFAGRARWLILPALLTSVAAVGAAALSFAGASIDHRSGGRSEFIGAGSVVLPRYRTGLGDFDLELFDYPSDASTSIDVGVGKLTVDVPDDARVQIDARVGLGSIDALGSTTQWLSPRAEPRRQHRAVRI